MNQDDINSVMTEYMKVVPEAMAMSMIALGNAMGHGNIEGVLSCLNHIETEMDAVVQMAARVTAAAMKVNEAQVSGFEVPDDISGLEDM